MNPRPLAIVAAGAALGFIGLKVWTASHPSREAVTAAVLPATPHPTLRESAPPEFTRTKPVAISTPVSTPSPRPLPPQKEALADIDNVHLMLRDFRTRLGGNPVGTNAEIMQSVMGGNAVQARLGPPEGQNVNDQGELVDRWGTPYFFHQLSKEQMEIRSAGPDRQMWTADDVVVK